MSPTVLTRDGFRSFSREETHPERYPLVSRVAEPNAAKDHCGNAPAGAYTQAHGREEVNRIPKGPRIWNARRAAGIVATILLAAACDRSEQSADKAASKPAPVLQTVQPIVPPEAEHEVCESCAGGEIAQLEALLPKIEDDAAKSLVRDDTKFALSLYRELSTNPGNIVFSPNSISSLTAWISAGARGETRAEIRRATRFSLPDAALHEETSRLDEYLKLRAKTSGSTLDLANSLWVRTGLPLVKSFVELSRTHYGAEPFAIDFKEDPEDAVRRVNAWISEKTHGRIDGAIPPDAISPLEQTAMFVSAVYFKGEWAFPFEENRTKNVPFCIPGSGTVDVPMMHRLGMLKYAETGGTRALELPYGEGSLAMVLILPMQSDGLSTMETALRVEKLRSLIDAMKETQVAVAVPKFDFGFQQELRPTLEKMGMPLAFSNDADFRAMVDADIPMWLNRIVHFSRVAVDEKGTTAASGTGEGTIVLGEISQPKQFVADHPFLFFVMDKRTGTILFIGRVANPSPESSVKPGTCPEKKD